MLILAMLMVVSVVGCSSPTTADPDPAPPAEEVVEGKYNDGTYEAVSDAGPRGYGKVVVTIENDEIVALELTEYTGFNEQKGDDYAYGEFHEAQAELTEAYIAANGTEGVDVFTGATSSSTKWTQALDRALEKALVEASSDAEYSDGIFMGATELGERGRKLAWVTIENDKIVEVELKETRFVDDNEEYKDEEYAFEAFHEALEEMPARFIEANGADVEIYTGATSSSTGWMEAVENALEAARK